MNLRLIKVLCHRVLQLFLDSNVILSNCAVVISLRVRISIFVYAVLWQHQEFHPTIQKSSKCQITAAQRHFKQALVSLGVNGFWVKKKKVSADGQRADLYPRNTVLPLYDKWFSKIKIFYVKRNCVITILNNMQVEQNVGLWHQRKRIKFWVLGCDRMFECLQAITKRVDWTEDMIKNACIHTRTTTINCIID